MNDPNLDHRINVKFFVNFGKDTNETCTILSKAVKECYVVSDFKVQIGSS
jgi:hypothetical protein